MNAVDLQAAPGCCSQMADIFISYASVDRPRVQSLVESLPQQGWSVWWDRTILPGKTWDEVLEAALADARCVIVLWSRHSVESDWVHIEADEASAAEFSSRR